jgi:hypothetical protein
VLYSGQGLRTSALIRAELTPPFPGAVVLHATLSLFAMRHTNDAGVDLEVYPLSRGWETDQATWLRPQRGAYWDVSGARGVGTDRDEALVTTTHIENCRGSARWYAFDVTRIAARWLSDPQSNHGFLIEGQDHVFKGTTFASGDHVDASIRPRLVVRYGWPQGATILQPSATATPQVTPTSTPTATATPTLTATPTATRVSWRLKLPMILG